MIRVATTFMLASALALQTPHPLPRLGGVAQKLTAADLVQIVGLARAGGQEAWLLEGWEAFSAPQAPWSVRAYLMPTLTTAELRRGQIMTVGSAGIVGGGRQPWRPWDADSPVARQERLEGWAQVAILGRSVDDISGDRDVNRPFVVHGELSDQEIVSVVTFIRSSPELTSQKSSGSPAEISRRVKGEWPLGRLNRLSDGTVEALLLEFEYQFQSVRLRQADGLWVITGLGLVISG